MTPDPPNANANDNENSTTPNKRKRIFVQIASYRDPQLIPTVESLLENADDPDQFTFGICWQYGPEEDPNHFDGRSNFRVYKVVHSLSKGLGWARHVTNLLYRGEEYTLQIDSHHRFLKGWDTQMLKDYEQARTMADKPIITTYVPPFSPREPLPEARPTLMSQYEFSPDRLLMSRPWYIPGHESLTCVIRARTMSGHFFFTQGSFITEVPYDPDIFFGGYVEEVTLSARAYTSGYDFFSPYRCYLFHEYTREGRPKIWEDKPKDTVKWDAFARDKTRQLFGQEEHGIDMGAYGLGKKRSFHEWEVYAGLDFKKCRIHQYTLDVKEPPNPIPWEAGFTAVKYNFRIKWDAEKIKRDISEKKPSNMGLKCLTLGIETSQSTSLHRADMDPNSHPEVFSFEQQSVVVTFMSSYKPAKWVMWPLFEDGSWGTRQEGPCVNA
jgi:Glycosyltransferase (GlcNAc)